MYEFISINVMFVIRLCSVVSKTKYYTFSVWKKLLKVQSSQKACNKIVTPLVLRLSMSSVDCLLSNDLSTRLLLYSIIKFQEKTHRELYFLYVFKNTVEQEILDIAQGVESTAEVGQ